MRTSAWTKLGNGRCRVQSRRREVRERMRDPGTLVQSRASCGYTVTSPRRHAVCGAYQTSCTSSLVGEARSVFGRANCSRVPPSWTGKRGNPAKTRARASCVMRPRTGELEAATAGTRVGSVVRSLQGPMRLPTRSPLPVSGHAVLRVMDREDPETKACACGSRTKVEESRSRLRWCDASRKERQ